MGFDRCFASGAKVLGHRTAYFDRAEVFVPDTVLDLKGLKCPLPVLKTRKALTRLDAGDSLTVLTTDPMAEIDIPHFCKENGHTLLEAERTDKGHRFLLRKGA
ncbi:MAG: sulfurtransferase TusA family protein [Roseibium sp.]|nr:sulfurtransferase TusA family protein [Roseibium sp.]